MAFGPWTRMISLWQRVGARARDAAFISFSLLVSLTYFVSGEPERVWRRGGVYPVAFLVLTVGASMSLWWRRRAPATITTIGLVVYALTLMPVAQAVGLFTLAVRRRDRVLVAYTVVGAAVFTIGSSVGTSASWLSLAFIGVIEAGFAAAAGSYIGARHDLLVSLRERADRAEAERELRADQARVAERTRIAQEMHDVLAHKVSLIALHAGALEVNVDAGPDAVRRSASLIRTTAREAMEDLRDVLGVLRSGAELDGADVRPQPTVADIERIVDASRAAGIPVRLTMDVGEMPDVVARTAYRVVQEGLTNVHKHARGAATAVTVAGDPQRGVSVEVVNQRPVAAGTLLPGSGAGLVGLRERISLAGGTMRSGPCPDGWRLSAWMPWVPT